MPRKGWRKKTPVPMALYKGQLVPRRQCGDRFLPMNPAFEHTKIIPTAPQTWNWSQCGAKAWG